MTTTQVPPAPKKPEEKPVAKEGLENAKEETKFAMLLIQTNSTMGKDQVTATLTKKFPHLTPERATRLYEDASRQLVIDKDRRNAEHYIERTRRESGEPDPNAMTNIFPRLFHSSDEAKEFLMKQDPEYFVKQCLKDKTHPEIHTLMTRWPDRFKSIEETQDFQQQMLKKYQNNHTLPKTETIKSPPPVIPSTPPTTSKAQIPAKVNGSKPVMTSSELSNSKPLATPQTQQTATKTQVPQNMSGSKTQSPQNITVGSTPWGVKPDIITRVIKEAPETIRAPIWRAFNVYADDDRCEDLLLETIVTQVFSPRTTVDDDYIKSLATSLKEDGQERGIVVTPREGKLAVVSGECRVLAARKLGWTKIKGLSVAMTEEQAIAIALAANLEHDLPHQALTPIQEGKQLQKLIAGYKWTQERAADFFNKSQTWVNFRLNLLATPEDVQDKVEEGKLTERHVRSLTSMPPDIQSKVADKIAEKDLSVRETENLARAVKAEPERVDEILANNQVEITECPEKLKSEIVEEIGAVPVHKDTKGIYFFKFPCKVCGADHSASVNIEQGVAIVKGPEYLTKKKGAA